ncbi:hypothetical protein Scep_029035 [Stephania cephalantha]|uniref:Reverse transcriptase domain-containing protein n=1 Tax=Stephania cephalantha TaxID=152367 RepID=A0AAP0HIQ6_9MAGN
MSQEMEVMVEPKHKMVLKVDDVPIVCEFPDVFLDDLPGLPQPRVVEFIIELIPGTHPIYSRPYKMSAVRHVS